jgi:hypothetical protein
MSNATKHHFTCNEWDFKWLLLDVDSNAYIDVNQLSRIWVTGDLVNVMLVEVGKKL